MSADNESSSRPINELRRVAEDGNAEAQNELGERYDEGLGVSKDSSEAAKWFRLAAEQGYDAAQINLARCYKHGAGVSADFAEAAKWRRKAAEQGNSLAQLYVSFDYEHGHGILEDQPESVKWLQKSAENGEITAQTLLGMEYLKGERMPMDAAKAVQWFRRAADAGFAAGQAFYGACLSRGDGIVKDEAEAVKWFQKAADQEDCFGAYYLGFCLAQGRGIPKDFAAARKWLTFAAEQHVSGARYELRRLFFVKHGILRWRDACIAVAGYGFLIYYALTAPFSINWLAIGAFLLILLFTSVLFTLAGDWLKGARVNPLNDKEEQTELENLVSNFQEGQWRLLLVPSEDGFFLLPLVYIGITPISAVFAATLFAVAHYPLFPWRYCIPKGIAFFFVALFVLPYGIWSVVMAHFGLDAALFLLVGLTKLERKPIFRRLLRALRN